MALYLVRHSVAVRRSEWWGSEWLRPLSGGGHRQAQRLADRLARERVQRVVSSPHLRCRQTLEPLAARGGMVLQTDPRLAEGAGLGATLELLSGLAAPGSVLCSHGDVITGLIAHLQERGLPLDAPLVCEKGSVWILDGPFHAAGSATYLPPPPKKRQRATVRIHRAPAGEPEEGSDVKHRLAVLDCGSTSFHLLVADVTAAGEIRRVLREREMLRLGAAVARRPRIPEKICVRAVETARELARHAEHADAERLLPVATAALREAENGRELAARIGEVLGTPVRLLSGREEARLIFAAFRQRIDLPEGHHVGLDLGGGSLELARGDAWGVDWETTLPLGVARLHREFVRSDPMSVKQERALRRRVRDLLAPAAREIARSEPGRYVATGGTVNALARRIATRRTSWSTRHVGQLFVPRHELEEVAEELVATDHDDRLRLAGISKGRADLLPTGAVVLDELVERLGIDGFTVSDWGLREGVILESLGLATLGEVRRGEG